MVCRFQRGVVARTYDFERLSLIRSEIALEASVVFSGRAVSENSCIRGRCLKKIRAHLDLLSIPLFGEGDLRELVQLVIRGECFTGDDSIVYDRSFA